METTTKVKDDKFYESPLFIGISCVVGGAILHYAFQHQYDKKVVQNINILSQNVKTLSTGLIDFKTDVQSKFVLLKSDFQDISNNNMRNIHKLFKMSNEHTKLLVKNEIDIHANDENLKITELNHRLNVKDLSHLHQFENLQKHIDQRIDDLIKNIHK